MTVSLTTTIRRLLGLVVAVAAIALPAGVQAGTGQTAPPQSAIDNASVTWAMKGYMLDAQGSPVFAELPPLAAIQAASDTWAAKARLLNVDGRPFSSAPQQVAAGGGSGLDWSDFGIGAAAMLGLVLLAGGIAVAVRTGHRGAVRTRPA